MSSLATHIGALGWLDDARRPPMFARHSEGRAPILRALVRAERTAEPFPNAHTAASGVGGPAAVGDSQILDALRESQGAAPAARPRSSPGCARSDA